MHLITWHSRFGKIWYYLLLLLNQFIYALFSTLSMTSTTSHIKTTQANLLFLISQAIFRPAWEAPALSQKLHI